MYRALRMIARGALAAIVFTYFGLGCLALAYVLLPLACRGAAGEAERTRRAHALVARGLRQFHGLIRAFRLVHYDPAAVDLGLPDGPCVVVSNHPTLIDTTAITAAIGGACTVVRGDLFEHPMLGPLLQRSGHLRAEGAGPMAGAAVIQGAMDRLAQGLRVLIFPEGTRSPPGGMRRFRRGAFEVACRAGAPVVLAFVTCTPPMLAKGAPWYAMPERMAVLEVARLALLRPEDFDRDPVRMLRHAEALYRARLDAWRAAHPELFPPSPRAAVGGEADAP